MLSRGAVKGPFFYSINSDLEFGIWNLGFGIWSSGLEKALTSTSSVSFFFSIF
jgi:hypothetical protein